MDVTARADTNWTLPVLQTVAKDVVALALACKAGAGEFALETEASKRVPLDMVADKLRKVFPIMNMHRLPPDQVAMSKKLGFLGIGNLVLRIYFALGNVRACRTVVAMENSTASLPLSSFPRHELVVYRYFRGRVAVFEGDLAVARSCLQYALANTPDTPGFARNRKRIVAVLVPVMMHFGQTPSADALASHGLQVYAPIVRAFVRGHVSEFHAALDERRAALIRTGVLLTLERLGQAVLRNLVRRSFDALAGSHVVPLDLVRAALAAVGQPSGADDAECAVSGLIHRGFLKGYVSHKMGKVVVAKKGACPLAAFDGRSRWQERGR